VIVAGDLLLGAGVLFLGIALLGICGCPDRSRLIAAWVALAGFAGLVLIWGWSTLQLKLAVIPVYYNLPSGPTDSQTIRIRRPGCSSGFRGQIVRRKDRTFDWQLYQQLISCDWKITICEDLVLSHHTCGRNGVIEFASKYDEVSLQYQVNQRTRPLLAEAVLEVTCPEDFRSGVTGVLHMTELMLGLHVGGMLLAALGITLQRRRIRRHQEGYALSSMTGS
jgi:hypothetical protein